MIIALASLIGFSVTACSSDPDQGNNPDTGSLTITGLEDFNGKYVIAPPWDDDPPGLIASVKIDFSAMSLTGGKVVNGKVTLNVWSWDDYTTLSSYSGNDKNYKFSFWHNTNPVFIIPTEEESTGYVIASFTNGIGTGVWYSED